MSATDTREPDTHEIKVCPMCGYPHMAPIGSVFRLPGDEVETMADAIAMFNEHEYRKTKTWRAYANAYGVEMAMNALEFTAFREFEAVAVARRIKREEGGRA